MFSRPGCMLRQGSHGLDRGIYEPVPGLLDTLFVPKVVRVRGVAIEKSLHLPRFATGYGPSRRPCRIISTCRIPYTVRTTLPAFMHNSHAAPSRRTSQADPLRAFMPIIIHVTAIGSTAEPEISAVCKASISRR